MFEFDYDKESEIMNETKTNADVITSEYIRKLSLCSVESLQALNIIYAYNKLLVIANMTPKNRTSFEEERKEKLAQALNYLKKKLQEYYSYDIESTEEITRIVERIKVVEEARTDSAYNIIQEYKLSLQELYIKSQKTVNVVLPDYNLKSIKQAKHRENQYLNEIVDAIFAVGDYEGLMAYIARANVGGMIVKKDQIILPRNPFNIEESSKEKLKLISPVSIYHLNVKEFEPVVDFYLDIGNKPILRFNNEWIARKESIRCKESIVDYLPYTFLLSKNVNVRENGSIININEIINSKYQK